MNVIERVKQAHAALVLAQEAEQQALAAVIAEKAHAKVGDDLMDACGNHHFRVERVTAAIEHGRIDITYTGHRLKKDGTVHATARSCAWQHIEA